MGKDIITFELDGLQELLDKAERMYGNTDDASVAYLEGYGEAVLEGEKQLVRVDTAKTQKSLKVSKVKTQRSVKTIWIGDVDRKRGAIPWYLEHGVMRGGKLVKYPFMRPAAYQRKADGMQRGLKRFEEVLKGVAN